jgi:hypothetical protein
MQLFLKRKTIHSKWAWAYGIPVLAFVAAVVCASQNASPAVFHRAFALSHEVPLFFLGLALLFYGFTLLRKKWIIDNTPTSKVRSVAMGHVEIQGTALKKFQLQSPLSKTECVYYNYQIEKEQRGSKGRTRWVTVEQGASTVYFNLQDATGVILIDPKDAEVITLEKFRSIEQKGLTKYRYTESFILHGQQIYVLGCVTKFRDPIADHRQQLIDALRGLKQDRAKLMQYDINGDGNLSPEEWDIARTETEKKLLEVELTQEQKDDLVVAAGRAEMPFIISSTSEKEVSNSMLWRSIAFSAGGAALSIFMCVSMLGGAGWLPQTFAIPWHLFYN